MCCKGCGKQDNKLNTYDWLADIPGNAELEDMVEIQFKNTRKGYYKNSNRLKLEKGDTVAVEASPGHDIGVVTLTGRLVPLQMRKANIKPDAEIRRIYRKAKPVDLEKYREAKSREHDTMIRSRQIALQLGLQMKIGDVEYQGDGNKAIFYYIADERVDFRQLIKVLAEVFRVRIEMKQIGARQDQLCLCLHQCRTLSRYFTQPTKACRSVRQIEMLSQLRSGCLRGMSEKAAQQRNYPGNR